MLFAIYIATCILLASCGQSSGMDNCSDDVIEEFDGECPGQFSEHSPISFQSGVAPTFPDSWGGTPPGNQDEGPSEAHHSIDLDEVPAPNFEVFGVQDLAVEGVEIEPAATEIDADSADEWYEFFTQHEDLRLNLRKHARQALGEQLQVKMGQPRFDTEREVEYLLVYCKHHSTVDGDPCRHSWRFERSQNGVIDEFRSGTHASELSESAQRAARKRNADTMAAQSHSISSNIRIAVAGALPRKSFLRHVLCQTVEWDNDKSCEQMVAPATASSRQNLKR